MVAPAILFTASCPAAVAEFLCFGKTAGKIHRRVNNHSRAHAQCVWQQPQSGDFPARPPPAAVGKAGYTQQPTARLCPPARSNSGIVQIIPKGARLPVRAPHSGSGHNTRLLQFRCRCSAPADRGRRPADGPHGWRRRSPQKKAAVSGFGVGRQAQGRQAAFGRNIAFCRTLPPQCAASRSRRAIRYRSKPDSTRSRLWRQQSPQPAQAKSNGSPADRRGAVVPAFAAATGFALTGGNPACRPANRYTGAPMRCCGG